MVSEEDEVPLVVECDHSPPSELWVLREERSQESAHPHADLGVEVVEDELRDMLSCNGMMLYLLLILYACDFKDGQHSLEMADEQFPSIGVPEHHHVRVVERLCVSVDFLQLHLPPGVEGDVVEDHHDLFQEVVDFDGRLELGCD
jgi:hypothetical protein